MTGRGNNTYLLIGGDGGVALVDAGAGHPQHLLGIAEQLAASRARLDVVFVTHGHADHASGAPALAAAHPGARFAKYPWPGEDARYAVAWRPLADGDAVRIGGESLTVLHTPGHSPDHVAFWHEPSRTAFTGDLVVAGAA